MSSPRLAPRLMPEMTRRGRSRRMPLIARLTQSVGVPSTAKARGPTGSMRSGRCKRQRVADRALIAVRRDHPDLVQIRQRLAQRREPIRGDAVVIAQQNGHTRQATTRRRVRQTLRSSVARELGISLVRDWRDTNTHARYDDTSEGRIGAAGFEPTTTRTPSECATSLRHAPNRECVPSLNGLRRCSHSSATLRDETQPRPGADGAACRARMIEAQDSGRRSTATGGRARHGP